MMDAAWAARLQAVFELSPTILTVTGLDDGRIVEVNDAFLLATGYARDEVIGRSVPDVAVWVDPRQRDAGLAELRAGRSIRNVEARFRAKNGREIVAITNADVIVIDGRSCILTALIDITDRVRAETALRESERRFAQLFHANPLPMTIVSMRTHRHLDVNDAAVRHSGYSREEMLGRTKPELGFWVAAEQRDDLLHQLLSSGQARDFEVTFRTKTGETRQLLTNSEVITYEGEPAVLSVSVDITERKQLETQREARREEAENLTKAKDEFLAILSHELRNPLGAITNALGVMDRLATSQDLRKAAGIIARQATRLTRLVDDLLDVARVTSGKIVLRLEPVDLLELAERCASALREAGRARDHRLEVDGESVLVHGDLARLEQVINNLLDNALKYTASGGEILLTTERVGSDAVLRVRDTGEGIRSELGARVFDLFVQEPQALDRSRGGLGLGLALVKQLVELHGGSVSMASGGRGHGSEFVVRLPASAVRAASAPPEAPAPGAAQNRRRRVLVVEDNADAREGLRLLLTYAGHEVETSEDASSGLDKLKSFRPEVALIDIGLPGVDGYALARMARQTPEAKATYLVALTGYGQAEDRQKALAAGFDTHMTKPVDPAKLCAFLTES
jgi:PAS domain S-box-containing protein